MYMYVGVFDLRPMEHTAGDEDADMDDDPILEGVMYIYMYMYMYMYIICTCVCVCTCDCTCTCSHMYM